MSSSSSNSSSSLSSLSSSSSLSSASVSSLSSSTSSSPSSRSSGVQKHLNWRVSKPLFSALPAIDDGVVFNRLCQVMSAKTSAYTVGRVACYLEHFISGTGQVIPAIPPTSESSESPESSSSSSSSRSSESSSSSDRPPYNVILQAYETDINGFPLTLKGTAVLTSDTIQQAGWYFFDFSLPPAPAPTYKLAFVMHQDGGNEDDYVCWFYAVDPQADPALMSPDGVTWTRQPGVSRTIQILDGLDMFSQAYGASSLHAIATAPGQGATTIDALANGNFSQTSIQGGEVVLQHPDLVVSLVIDGSGSAGWNDRTFRRCELAKKIIKDLPAAYPGSVLFDVVTFNGIQGGPTQVASTPVVAPQVLGISAATKYNSDNTFAPAVTGDPALSNVVAYGFKGLQPGHTYHLANISSQSIVIEDGQGLSQGNLHNQPVNLQSVGANTNPVTFRVDASGPQSQMAIVASVPASGATRFRKPFSSRPLPINYVTTAALAGDTVLVVDDTSNVLAGAMVDAIDTNSSLRQIAIVSVASSTTLSLAYPLPANIGTGTTTGGYIQPSVVNGVRLSESASISVLLMDEQNTSNPAGTVIFYLETSDGSRFEWTVIPQPLWSYQYRSYFNETETLKIAAQNSQGNPVDDGTEISLYVDTPPSGTFAASATFTTGLVGATPQEGDTRIQIDPAVAATLKTGSTVVLYRDAPNEQSLPHLVIQVSDGWLTILPPLEHLSWVPTGIQVTPPTPPPSTGQATSVTPTVVDVTPMYAGRSLSWQAGDPQPVAVQTPTEPHLNQYNQDASRFFSGSFSAPMVTDVSGLNGLSTLRVLPITIDSLDEPDMGWVNQPSIEQPDQVPGVVFSSSSSSQGMSGLANSESSSSSGGRDYYLDTPVFTSNGTASAHFRTKAKALEFASDKVFGTSYGGLTGLSQPNDFKGDLTKNYTVWAFLNSRNVNGDLISQEELTSFSVSFVSPYLVLSRPETDKDFSMPACVSSDPSSGPSTSFSAHGPYSASGQGYYIDYLVAEKGAPLGGTDFLNVRIYDCTRSASQLLNPEQFQPDLTAGICDFSKTYLTQTAPGFFYNTPDPSGGAPASIFDTFGTLVEATYLPGYTSGGIALPLSFGQARLQLSPLDSISARLMVVAEYKIPNDPLHSVYKIDYVWYRNPLEIVLDIPGAPKPDCSGADAPCDPNRPLASGYDSAPYPITATVLFMGVPVPDNVPVVFSGGSHNRFLSSPTGIVDPSLDSAINTISNFPEQSGVLDYTTQYGTWPPTPITPSVGVTIGGSAAGSTLGPHGPVVNHSIKYADGALTLGDIETITATVSYGNFTASDSLGVDWFGPTDNGGDFSYVLQVYVNGANVGAETQLFADGWDSCVVVADLPASVDQDLIAESVVDALLGKTQSGVTVGSGNPRLVSFQGVSGDRWHESQPIDSVPPYPVLGSGGPGGVPNRGYAVSRHISNAAIIPPAPACPPDPDPETGQTPCGGACCLQVSSGTAYLSDGVIFEGKGCGDGDCTFGPCQIWWAEPLSGNFEVIPRGAIRDGVNPTDVWLDVSFSGRPIPLVAREHQVKDSNGNDIGMPVVTFDAYKIVAVTDPVTGHQANSLVHDASISLQTYQVRLSLSITSNTVGHYHTCTVDSFGNGTTTGTYLQNSVTPTTNHVHVISNFVVLPTNSHIHELKSVARTTLNPTSNQVDSIHITANFHYDASRTPIDRTGSFEYVDTPKTPEEIVIGDSYFLKLSAPQNALADISNGVDQSGFNLQVTLNKYTSGSLVTIPADGLRTYWKLQFFDFQQNQQPGKVYRLSNGSFPAVPYLLLKVSAQVTIAGQTLTASGAVAVLSSNLWTKQAIALTPGPTSDPVYLDIFDSIACFGPSPINDAVYLAASRLINWQAGSPLRLNAQKAIILLTDGWENNSDRTISEAINAIQRIGNSPTTPCSTVEFGQQSLNAQLILEGLAEASGAPIAVLPPVAIPLPDAGSSSSSSGHFGDLAPLVDELFASALSSANHGDFNNIIDLGRSKLINSVAITVDLPPGYAGSSLTFRYRTSGDGSAWSAWSAVQTVTSTTTVTIEGAQIQRYLQYDVGFHGNENFVAPSLSRIQASYVEPRDHFVLFTPIATNSAADEYVSEVTISDRVDYGAESSSSSENGEQNHAALSVIRYGFANGTTVLPENFFSPEQPPSMSGRRKFTLCRANEPLVQLDARRFRLAYSGWPSEATLIIYDLSNDPIAGKLVSPENYTANAQTGLVTFSTNKTGSRFSSTLVFPPSFGLICSVTNYSDSPSDAVALRNIGVSWNVTKSRTPGINAPLASLISSSSSSSTVSASR